MAPPQNVVLDLGNNPSQGQATAKLTLIEFSDFQCPFCGRHARDTAPQIDKEYVSTGKVRHVFLNYPLESMHKVAFKAAETTNCAGEQGKYWEMNHRLFENQNKLEPLTPHAEAIGLDVHKFEECMSSGPQAMAIRRNIDEAQKSRSHGHADILSSLHRSQELKDQNCPQADGCATVLRILSWRSISCPATEQRNCAARCAKATKSEVPFSH